MKELGATELERGKAETTRGELNPRTREVEALLVRRASVTRTGTGVVAICRNFLGIRVGRKHICPKQTKGLVVGDDFAAGKQGGDQVRGTKYKVKELGATELRGGVGERQSRNDARGISQCTREVETLLVRRASVTRIGTGVEAIRRNFLGTGVEGKSEIIFMLDRGAAMW